MPFVCITTSDSVMLCKSLCGQTIDLYLFVGLSVVSTFGSLGAVLLGCCRACLHLCTSLSCILPNSGTAGAQSNLSVCSAFPNLPDCFPAATFAPRCSNLFCWNSLVLQLRLTWNSWWSSCLSLPSDGLQMWAPTLSSAVVFKDAQILSQSDLSESVPGQEDSRFLPSSQTRRCPHILSEDGLRMLSSRGVWATKQELVLKENKAGH